MSNLSYCQLLYRHSRFSHSLKWYGASCVVSAIIIFAQLTVSAAEKKAPSPQPTIQDLKPEPVKPQEMQFDYDVFTRESIVEIEGKKYRKIEYQTHVVYLQLIEGEAPLGDLEVMCRDGNQPPPPTQVLVAVQVTKRSSFFIDGLKRVCQQMRGGSRIVIDPAIRIGFTWKSQPKDFLQNKTIFISPWTKGLGFSAEW